MQVSSSLLDRLAGEENNEIMKVGLLRTYEKIISCLHQIQNNYCSTTFSILAPCIGLVILLPKLYLSSPVHGFQNHHGNHQHRHRHHHQPGIRQTDKRHAETSSSEYSTIAELRETIAILEGYQRYYQHLLLRGYLSDDDTRRLESLGQLIDQLKTALHNTQNNGSTASR